MLRGMRSSRVAALCVVAASLLFAVVAARGKSAVPGSLRDVPLERGTGGGVSSGGMQLNPSKTDINLTDEIRLVQSSIVVVAMMLLLVAFAAFLRRMRNKRRRPRLGLGVDVPEEQIGSIEATMQMRLRRAATQARTELAARSGGPPGDAVVAAWLRLEEAAAHEGAGREPFQTATEFTAALLDRYTTSEPALDELRVLYQRARFGDPGQVGDAEVDAAVDALDRILHALANAATPAVARS